MSPNFFKVKKKTLGNTELWKLLEILSLKNEWSKSDIFSTKKNTILL